MLIDIIKELHKKKNPKRAVDSQRFFKTAKGEYAAGDVFLGITVPEIRAISKKWRDADFATLKNCFALKFTKKDYWLYLSLFCSLKIALTKGIKKAKKKFINFT